MIIYYVKTAEYDEMVAWRDDNTVWISKRTETLESVVDAEAAMAVLITDGLDANTVWEPAPEGMTFKDVVGTSEVLAGIEK